MNILVIDDCKEVGWVIEKALEFKRVKVEWVASGMEGIERARQEPFDLILLDVDMPYIDGFETCRRFKKDGVLKFIPIVFISGRADLETRMTGLDLGAEYFLSKPFELQELWSIVHFMMSEGKRLSSEIAARLIA